MTTHLERYQHKSISMGFRAGNPYEHPKNLRDTARQLRAKAQAYFGWELMSGADIEKLKKDPYWSYMEEQDEPTT